MKTLSSLIFFILSLSFPAAAQPWLDKSHTIFLPPALKENLSLQMELPFFWWSFVVIEPTAAVKTADFARARELCEKLESIDEKLIAKSACPSLHAFLPLISDWSQDVFLRTDAPSPPQLRSAFQEARGRASLPMGREILNIVRMDPFESYLDLKNLMMKNVTLGLTQKQGFFVDEATQRIALPVQFAFSPQEMEKTERTLTLMGMGENSQNSTTTIIGSHISSMENQKQIFKDLEKVTALGFLLMAAQILFILIRRRWKFFWLIPPVLLGVAGAAAITVLIFGSIHGLTLSLGVGIIALALDFGLHSALNTRWAGVWRANLFGLLTTFAGLLAISLSGVPLLRQMMVFAMLGLTISYLIYFWLHSRRPDFFLVEPFRYVPRAHHLKTLFTLILLLLGFYGLFAIPPNLNMHQFDFQKPKTRDTMIWLYSLIQKQMPIFSVHDRDEKMFDVAQAENDWALKNDLVHSNFYQFLPNPSIQKTHSQSWQLLCALHFFSPEESQLFEPFLRHLPCPEAKLRDPTEEGAPLPSYLRDTISNKKWLAVWYPKNSQEIEAIKKYDPQVFSLAEMVQKFPETLGRELRWMLPLSLGICLLLLWLYNRDLTLSLITLIPFFTGVGFYFAGVLLLGWSFSFISIIALIMVFGLSIDYGIFATNLYTLSSPPSAEGVWSCLWLAAAVTFLGFLPLAVCHHPVLIHLGQTLVAGTAGTWIGTAWGIPGIFQLRQKI